MNAIDIIAILYVTQVPISFYWGWWARGRSIRRQQERRLQQVKFSRQWDEVFSKGINLAQRPQHRECE